MTNHRTGQIRRDIVVVGSSAGGLPALQQLVAGLPMDFDAAVLIVQHMPAYSPSNLHHILGRQGNLPVMVARDGEEIESGNVYVATPDHHLLVENGKMLVKRGPKENRFRPSIDALFRSAAYNYGSRVIGVVLSGALDDGTSGCWTIKRLGGVTITQDPDDSLFPQMPLNAQEHVAIDYSLPAAKIAALLSRLINEPGGANPKLTTKEKKLLEVELVIAKTGGAFQLGIINLGELSPFTCPECHGALVQLTDGEIIRFRCHTGHAYTINALLSEVSTNIEGILTQAMQSLEESTMLLIRLGEHFDSKKMSDIARVFYDKASQVQKQSRNVYDAVQSQQIISADIRYEHD
ncbi:chemotaxis protein CheB [Dyadobacter sandarakinus]|uniref:protein-glutamate methylesterase n=1 Tax=Dyadobacter sandarakinus TaxID=2747268 RepID=A0ABX7IAX4_9BACT|nr:chemotaxis protein CheB [Dyadobacter sandarakinus]QRR03256.1 chemotaxis protein CheB [Dyadobacter sandarakinus]